MPCPYEPVMPALQQQSISVLPAVPVESDLPYQPGGAPMKKILWLGIVLILFVCSSTASAKRPIKFEDLTRVQRKSAPQVSPDGESLAYFSTRGGSA